MIEVCVVPADLIRPFDKLAARDNIALKIGEQRMVTTWFGAYSGSHLIGFAGVAAVRAHSWRMRALWVQPAERGQGASVALAAAWIGWLKGCADPSDAVQIFHNHRLPLGFWQDRGFQVSGRRLSNGKGAYELIAFVENLTIPLDTGP